MQRAIVAVLILSSAAFAETKSMSLTLTSPDFTHESQIPKLHTCEGKDLSPALEWKGAPANTKSYVLIVDDPDAPDPKHPKQTWVHWVVYNLPAETKSLPQNAKSLPSGAKEGVNDFKKSAYGGPCPPIGRHRYFFKLYALDTQLPDLGKASKADVERAMKGHVIGQAELMGTYEKGS